jgi:hypothetical protein
MDNARGHKVELEYFTADCDRMTSIIAAAKTGYVIDMFGQQIGDPAFSFVPPLSAYNDI